MVKGVEFICVFYRPVLFQILLECCPEVWTLGNTSFKCEKTTVPNIKKFVYSTQDTPPLSISYSWTGPDLNYNTTPGSRAHPASCTMGTRSLSRGQNSRGLHFTKSCTFEFSCRNYYHIVCATIVIYFNSVNFKYWRRDSLKMAEYE